MKVGQVFERKCVTNEAKLLEAKGENVKVSRFESLVHYLLAF